MAAGAVCSPGSSAGTRANMSHNQGKIITATII